MALGQFWEYTETLGEDLVITLGQFWDSFEATLVPHGDFLVTVGGAV